MKQRNYSLDVARLIAALVVVVCHAYVLEEADFVLHQFVARFAPRVSVSMFFAISGYYYIKSINKKGIFKKQMRSLLSVYIAWTMIYYAASFVDNVLLGEESIGKFLAERVIFFFTEGSYSHFWFFTAMIYSVILATVANRLGGEKGLLGLTMLSLVLFAIGNLGTAYYTLGQHIPMLNVLYGEYAEVFFVFRGIFCMGLPYFMIGYWLNRWEERILTVEKKRFGMLYILASVLYIAEIVALLHFPKAIERPEVFIMLYPMAFMLMALLLRNPKPQWSKAAPFCKRMSSFIYYVHPLLILVYGLVADMAGVQLHSCVLYVLVIGTAMLVGVVAMKLSERVKFLNYFV